jgi:hypothetical protein
MNRFNEILHSINTTLSEAHKTQSEEHENETPEMEMQEYKDSYYGMSIGSLKAIASHAMDILNNLDNPTVKENLTAAHLQGMIAVAEDHLRSIHDFVMFVDEDDDTEESESATTEVEPQKKKKRIRIKDLPHYTYYSSDDTDTEQTTPQENQTLSGSKPGLWDNIRKKKQKEGKNYRPARTGEKDRPDPEQWKKLTK